LGESGNDAILQDKKKTVLAGLNWSSKIPKTPIKPVKRPANQSGLSSF